MTSTHDPDTINKKAAFGVFGNNDLLLQARPNNFVRLKAINGLVENDATPWWFITRKGLENDKCVSFESFRWPGQFLRQRNGVVRLEKRPLLDFDFNKDATFISHRDMLYESLALREKYLYAQGSRLILSEAQSAFGSLFTAGAFPRAFLGLYAIRRTPLFTEDGVYWSARLSGKCTGVTPWFEEPVTRRISYRLAEYVPKIGQPRADSFIFRRTVVQVARSTAAYGFYPYIKLHSFPHHVLYGYRIYKIEQGNYACIF